MKDQTTSEETVMSMKTLTYVLILVCALIILPAVSTISASESLKIDTSLPQLVLGMHSPWGHGLIEFTIIYYQDYPYPTYLDIWITFPNGASSHYVYVTNGQNGWHHFIQGTPISGNVTFHVELKRNTKVLTEETLVAFFDCGIHFYNEVLHIDTSSMS